MSSRGCWYSRVVVVAVLGLFAHREAGAAPPQKAPFEAFSDWSYYNRIGWQALERGRVDRAEQAFRLAIARMRPYEATESITLARSYADLARVLHQRGRHDEAAPLASYALSVRETSPGVKSEALCQVLELLARIQVDRKRDAEAEPLLKRVLVVRESVVGAGHADLIPVVEALAEVYARQGKLAEAEPVFKRALALREANHAEMLKKAEEQERMAEVLRVVMTADGMANSPGAAKVMMARSVQVQKIETRAETIRESSAESLSAAATTEHYSVLLRRAGRADEADEMLARGKAIRDLAETRKARAAAGR